MSSQEARASTHAGPSPRPSSAPLGPPRKPSTALGRPRQTNRRIASNNVFKSRALREGANEVVPRTVSTSFGSRTQWWVAKRETKIHDSEENCASAHSAVGTNNIWASALRGTHVYLWTAEHGMKLETGDFALRKNKLLFFKDASVNFRFKLNHCELLSALTLILIFVTWALLYLLKIRTPCRHARAKKRLCKNYDF